MKAVVIAGLVLGTHLVHTLLGIPVEGIENLIIAASQR